MNASDNVYSSRLSLFVPRRGWLYLRFPAILPRRIASQLGTMRIVKVTVEDAIGHAWIADMPMSAGHR